MSAFEALKVLGGWTNDQIDRNELWIDGLRVDSAGKTVALENLSVREVVEITHRGDGAFLKGGRIMITTRRALWRDALRP